MMLATAFHFIRPAWLLLIPIAIVVWWLTTRMHDTLRGWRRTVDETLLRAMTIGSATGQRLRQAILLLAWLVSVVAIAGPTWKPEPSPFADDPIPAIVLLKADESMLTDDLVPSRLERAQLEIVDLANQRKGQPLGLIAYSATPHLVLPPTRDTSIVAEMATEISPDIMPDEGRSGAADLSAALRLGVSTMGETQGTIIIVADALSQNGDLVKFREENGNQIVFLSTSGKYSSKNKPTTDAINDLDAKVIELTADDADTKAMIQLATSTPVSVAQTGKTTRWHEAGWGLCPILLAICLWSFRQSKTTPQNDTLESTSTDSA